MKVKFSVQSGLFCDFFNFIVENGIYISKIKSTDFGFEAYCNAEDYIKIARTAKKFQCKTRIVKKQGVYFKIRHLLKRRGAILGILLVFICIYAFNGIIWRIDVIAPTQNITQDVYTTLYKNDIYVGRIFSRQQNRDARQQLFLKVDNVGYVTLNFYKGILTCTVDKTIEKLPYLSNQTNGNIVAAEGGVIEDLEVYTGFSQVVIGQSVAKGDILVSATYIDRNGTVQQVMPRAFINARCEREYTARVEYNKDVYVRMGGYTEDKILKALNFDFKIKKANIEEDKKYDIEKITYPLTFLKFRLPCTVESTKYYPKQSVTVTKNEQTAVETAQNIIKEMTKGDKALVEEITREYSYLTDENGVTLTCKVYGYYDITK